MSINKMLTLCASVLLLSACGGGSGGGGGPATIAPTASTGVFLDSAVAGLSYKTPTFSGTTNSLGEYDYLPGETVTFSIGGIVLGSSVAGPLVTPLSLVPGATDATDSVVTNIVRLLLTMDDDGDPDNGINISSAAATAAAGQTVDFTAPDLASDPGMSSLLAALPGTPPLVDTTTAQAHFAITLAAQSDWGKLSWGTGTWQGTPP